MATPQSPENAVGNMCQAEDSLEQQLQEREIPPPRIAPRPKNDGGGYDCEFVDPPLKALQTECSICLQILREPFLINCCGHSFCRLCIERIQRDGKPCPLCNEPSFTLMHNKGLQRTLGEFCVRCTHQKAGCQWTGELGKLVQHLNVNPEPEKQFEGCSFTQVECPHCHEYLMRSLIKKHLEEQCPKRPYSCDYCREYSSTFEDVEANHWPVCPRYFVGCPNECNWPHIIERQNLNHHLAKECPLQLVDCDFHYAGCEVKVLRKDMPQHLTENFTHMSLLATLNQKLANHLLKKDEQNVRLTMELQTQVMELQKMVEENQTQVEMLREENQILKQQLADNAEQTQMLKQQLAEQTQTLKDELVQKTQALKDRLGEQGEQQDALNHSVTMLREQQAHQQQEQTRLAEQTMNELGQQGQTLRTELTKETQALKQKHDALNQSLTRVREQQAQQQQEQARLGREKETLKNLKREVARETQALKTKQDRHVLAMQNLTETTESLRKEFKQSVTKLKGEQTQQQQNTEARINRLEREQGLNQQKVDKRFDALPQTSISQILMTDFAQHKRDNDRWYSEPFYSHLGGYKMCLCVDTNGCGNGKGTHVSVFVCLMRGQYDDSLKWPFRGDVTIQLLNQLEDGEHHTETIPFTDQTHDTVAGRVTEGERGIGLGIAQFIPHTELNKYLRNDCLCFRVSRVDLK